MKRYKPKVGEVCYVRLFKDWVKVEVMYNYELGYILKLLESGSGSREIHLQKFSRGVWLDFKPEFERD